MEILPNWLDDLSYQSAGILGVGGYLVGKCAKHGGLLEDSPLGSCV